MECAGILMYSYLYGLQYKSLRGRKDQSSVPLRSGLKQCSMRQPCCLLQGKKEKKNNIRKIRGPGHAKRRKKKQHDDGQGKKFRGNMDRNQSIARFDATYHLSHTLSPTAPWC